MQKRKVSALVLVKVYMSLNNDQYQQNTHGERKKKQLTTEKNIFVFILNICPSITTYRQYMSSLFFFP